MSQLRQCIDCGGVTTKGSPVSMPQSFGEVWSCVWCNDGWTGWPRVGDWRTPKDDDRTYPDGKWPIALGGGEEFDAKRRALAARGCVPV